LRSRGRRDTHSYGFGGNHLSSSSFFAALIAALIPMLSRQW
jgi:hypothetical protein